MTLQPQNKVIDHSNFLINGKLEAWKGPKAQVWSPLTDNQGDRILLGSTPDLSSEEGMKALSSARTAYDHGRGSWPTAPAFDRIAAMEKFIELMVPKRDEVVNLLMWEICKKRSDAEKEFDRTVTYLHETIDEYKNLHREGSHIMSVNGTLAQIRRG
ncbi:MAG TPA: NADP-dependent glyceraldehyde-3-phosphate dehydrogenase, partial [Flavobacteriales bacterium]|nr:NADP-dependent glyceraldehyde-3-phosphate dehydrogenase [Flavobacteriales bacterium]